MTFALSIYHSPPTTYGLVLAGGHGNRLWPLSTPERPKQFLQLTSNHTMLQDTVTRISSLIPIDKTFVVAGARYAKLVTKQLPKLAQENVIIEPFARGTAPCIGLAALKLAQLDPTAVMAVLPADHITTNKNRFLEVLEIAISTASSKSQLVTLGITPTYPATGYGYIEVTPTAQTSNGKQPIALSASPATHFTEKPNAEKAKQYIESGNYYWNSGMFIWRVDVILEEIKQHMPNLFRGLQEIKQHLGSSTEQRVTESVYRKLNKETIDYGVMEQSNRVAVLPTGDIGWDDIGDWDALHAISNKDDANNLIRAKLTNIDTQNCTIISETDKPIATLGISDLVIVQTDNALLVMDKNRAQDIKKLLKRVMGQES